MLPFFRIFLNMICAVLVTGISYDVRAEADQPKILVHYMPWYSTKAVSGQWGWHWTMNHFDPDKVKSDGRREIASHDYPLIGPYDSADPHALECHVLLMKFSGIDGVIIDWYGTQKHNDYAMIHRNTQRLIPLLKKAGLEFAICYEDRSVREMVKDGVMKADASVTHGAHVMEWLGKNWFTDDSYVTIDDEPLLLVFGPLHFKPPEWKKMVDRLPKRPRIYGLPHLASDSGFDGAFGWPPVSGGKQLKERDWKTYLVNLYARSKNSDAVIAVAFPGFQDIYKEAGVHDSYGHISHDAGETFQKTFSLALESKSELIQIATWNDYGEGTVIEPTRRFGFSLLEYIQKNGRDLRRYSPDDLRLPVILYQLRKNRLLGDEGRKQLDRVSALLFASKCAEARKILNELTDHQGEDGARQPATAEDSKSEGNEIPNPESKPRSQ